MLIVRTRADLIHAVDALRRSHGGLALVPTMGALHAGHLALLQTARESGPATVASIFVNPTQFAPNEDFARYPRDEAGDLAKLQQAGCDLAWLPDVATMYPPGDSTVIDTAGPSQGWEGDIRPGHFRGVTTVVAKLLGQVRPDAAVFGEKDWQQLQVIRRMATDLALPVRIIGAPIVREPDGLAMSSRNRFLTAAQRAQAPALHAALRAARQAIAGAAAVDDALAAARKLLPAASFSIDYLALVQGETLRPADRAETGARLIGAARLGSVRLLDNIAAHTG